MSAESRGTAVVIFDIDGTLTDSIGRVVSTLKRCGTGFGAPEPPDAVCRSVIGLSLKLAVARCYPESSDEEVSRFTDEYRRIYNEEDRTKPAQLFDGIESMLSELQKAGFALAPSARQAMSIRRSPLRTCLRPLRPISAPIRQDASWSETRSWILRWASMPA